MSIESSSSIVVGMSSRESLLCTSQCLYFFYNQRRLILLQYTTVCNNVRAIASTCSTTLYALHIVSLTGCISPLERLTLFGRGRQRFSAWCIISVFTFKSSLRGGNISERPNVRRASLPKATLSRLRGAYLVGIALVINLRHHTWPNYPCVSESEQPCGLKLFTN